MLQVRCLLEFYVKLRRMDTGTKRGRYVKNPTYMARWGPDPPSVFVPPNETVCRWADRERRRRIRVSSVTTAV